ncbi:TPA: hypothetical protein ACRX9A_001465, partial [Klebsiella pneumoniae]
MPITIHEIKEHYDHYGLHDMSAMPTAEYRKALSDGALFWIDHHDFVREGANKQVISSQADSLIKISR